MIARLDRNLCAVARDEAFGILKENKDRLGLTHEQIGQRIIQDVKRQGLNLKRPCKNSLQ